MRTSWTFFWSGFGKGFGGFFLEAGKGLGENKTGNRYQDFKKFFL